MQTWRSEFQRQSRTLRETPQDLEKAYCLSGCLLGTFSCDLPRGLCANIISIIQTGKLPKPRLNPERVCADAWRSVSVRQEEGLVGRRTESKQVMDRRCRAEAAGETGQEDIWRTQGGPQGEEGSKGLILTYGTLR